MLQNIRGVTCLGVTLLLASSLSTGVSAQEPSNIGRAKKQSVSQSFVQYRLGTGFGSFQDIQVPVSEDPERRADGKSVGSEFQQHGGFSLFGSLQTSYQGQNNLSDFELDFVQMRATSGPPETLSSSYTRVNARGRWQYLFDMNRSGLSLLKGRTASAGGLLMLRRSSFNNVSNGHFIDAAYVGPNLGIASETWSLEGHYARSVAARFGYSPDGILGGEPFKHSSTVMTDAGVTLSFFLAQDAALDLGIESERGQVVLNDLSEYAGLGLNVSSRLPAGRTYALETMVARIGFRKAL